METGIEAVHGEKLDPYKIAMQTVFGSIFRRLDQARQADDGRACAGHAAGP